MKKTMNESKRTGSVTLRVLFAAALVLLFAAAGVGAVSADNIFSGEIVAKEAPVLDDMPELLSEVDVKVIGDDNPVVEGEAKSPLLKTMLGSANPVVNEAMIAETGTEYATLDSAVSNVADGQNIKMLTDVSRSNCIILSNKKFTLDLNGTVISGSLDPVIKVTDGSIISLVDSSQPSTGKIMSTNGDGIDVMNNSKLSICGGTIKGTTSSSASGIYVKDSELSISGGSISGDYAGIYIGSYTIKGKEVTIDGGIITGDSYGILAWKNTILIVNSGSITGVRKAIYAPINGPNGSDIKINGGEIEGTGATSINGYGIEIWDSDLSISKGNIKGSYAGVYIYNTYGKSTGKKVTIDGGDIYGGMTGVGAMANAVLEINGGGISSEGCGIMGNGNAHGTEIVINDGVITGDVGGIFHPQNGNLIINGGEIRGATGIYIKSGNLRFLASAEGGTIIGTGDADPYTVPLRDGFVSTGDALVIDSCNYPGGKPVVSIASGKFKSVNNRSIGSYVKQDDPAQSGAHETRVTKFITGGIFSSKPDSTYIADGYACFDNSAPDTKATYPYAVLPAKIVTFMNGDIEYGVQTVGKGNLAVKPSTNPTKEGCYAFSGWFNSDGSRYNFDAPVITDITLYANWTEYHPVKVILGKPATCTETGLTDGKKCSVCDKTLVEQTIIPAAGHTVKKVAGYAASCTDPGLTDGEICSVCEIVLVAQETIRATGHIYSGEDVKIITKEPTYSEDGSYKLVQYCTVCDAEKETGSGTIPKLQPETKFTVTYNGNGAELGSIPVDSAKYAPNAAVTALEKKSLKKTGYTFAGWSESTTPEKIIAAGSSFTITHDTTLYAIWTPITYTVIFNANCDSSTGSMSPQLFTYDIEDKLLSNNFVHPKDGTTEYVFAGWAKHPNSAVKYADNAFVKNLANEPGKVINLYAQWNAVTNYNVVEEVSEPAGGKVIITAKEESFISENEGKTTVVITNKDEVTTSEVVVTVKSIEGAEVDKSANKVTIAETDVFDVNFKQTVTVDPKEETEKEVSVGVAFEIKDLHADNADEREVLNNLPKIGEGAKKAVETLVDSNMKVAAVTSGSGISHKTNEILKQKGITVTFTLNKEWVNKRCGSTIDEIKSKLLCYHSNLTDSTYTKLDGYGIEPSGDNYIITVTSHLGFSEYFVMTPKAPITIKYYSGDTLVSTVDAHEDDVVELNAVLAVIQGSKPANTYLGGIFLDSGFSSPANFPYETTAADVNFYAKWENNPTPTPDPDPQPSHSSRNDGYSIWLPGNMYPVTFYMNGHGAEIPAQSVSSGSTAVEPSPAPVADGYTFNGWYTDAGCTFKYDFSTPVTAAVDLYAGWTLNQPGVTPVKPTQTPASLAPFVGLLAGLGAAAVFFGLRRK